MTEFSRPLIIDEVGDAPITLPLVASEEERRALAERLDLLALETLTASATAHSAVYRI